MLCRARLLYPYRFSQPVFSFHILQVTLVKMVNEATANIPNWEAT